MYYLFIYLFIINHKYREQVFEYLDEMTRQGNLVASENAK
jgi:hypothetical protein